MCEFKSGIITKGKVFLAPEGNESHSCLLESLGIADTCENAMTKFVRVELLPPNGNKAADIEKWRFNIDQDYRPDWYNEDPERYEKEFRESVKEYIKRYFEAKNEVLEFGYAWTKIPTENGTMFVMDGVMDSMIFGRNNNYAESKVRRELLGSDLLKQLKEKYGEKLMPITTDLTSMDGMDDYGKVVGDQIATLTIPLLMKYGKQIPLVDRVYWLATPNQTPSRRDSSCVRCVSSDGGVGYYGCNWDGCGVRPFYLLNL